MATSSVDSGNELEEEVRGLSVNSSRSSSPKEQVSEPCDCVSRLPQWNPVEVGIGHYRDEATITGVTILAVLLNRYIAANVLIV